MTIISHNNSGGGGGVQITAISIILCSGRLFVELSDDMFWKAVQQYSLNFCLLYSPQLF